MRVVGLICGEDVVAIERHDRLARAGLHVVAEATGLVQERRGSASPALAPAYISST